MSNFAGTFYAGDAAHGETAQVATAGDRVHVTTPGAARDFARRDVRLESPLPGVARRLLLPGGACVETVDAAAVDALWAASRLERLAYAIESRWAASLAALAATAALAWLAIVVVLPLAADPIARSLSPEVERSLGAQTLHTLDAGWLSPSELAPERREEIARRFAELVAKEPDRDAFRLVFRNLGAPNAMALPGGTIVLADEMVELAASDDEILAVLAHEAGHVQARHAMRLVLRQSGVALLVTAFAGDATGMTFLAAALPALLIDSRYSREFEEEADGFALALLQRQGIGASAFADVMRRLERADGGDGEGPSMLRYLASHPLSKDRIRRAESFGK